MAAFVLELPTQLKLALPYLNPKNSLKNY